MSTTPGWYPDPAPESAPGALRWWDGQGWTEQTQAGQQPAQGQQVQLGKPVAPQQAPGHPAQHGYPAQPGYPAQQGDAVQQGQPGGTPVPAPPPVTHTPDGAALASPGKRLGAALLDWLIVGMVSLILASVFVAVVFGGGIASGAFDPSSSGDPGAGFLAAFFLGYLLLFAAATVFGLWYNVLRVRKVGATVGKQVLGLRIRCYHTDGQLTWAQVWARYGIPALIHGTVGLTWFVDVLWLLWDPHRQTLHDKLVGTVVVDTSQPRLPQNHPAVQHARAVPAARGWMCDGPNPQTPADYAR